MNSSMIVTGPLGEEAWQAIGWDGFETIGDEAHAYMYAQRTADGRIALGGRGIPYRFASGLDHDGAIATRPSRSSAGSCAGCSPPPRRRDRARVVRRARRAEGLVRDRHPGRGHRPGLGGRLHRPGRGRRQPGRAHARRPGAGRAQPAGHVALGRPPLAALGARAGPLGRRARPLRAYRTADRLESARGSERTSVLARAGDLISGIPH